MLQYSFTPRTVRLTGIIANIVFALWIVAQIIVCVCYQGCPQYSDAGVYRLLAQECLDADTWYPMVSHLETRLYVFNPGYVNYIILVHKMFGTFEAVAWLNIPMNIGLALLVAYFVRRQLGIICGNIALILFCILLSNLFVVAVDLTDLPFAFFAYGSLALLVTVSVDGGPFTRRRAVAFLVSGVLIGISNYIRPVALLFAVPSVLYLILSKGSRLKSLACYVGGAAAASLLICVFSYNLNGRFVVAASTSGVNLIMGANDDADGTYCGKVFEPGKMGDLSDYEGELNVYTRDSIYKARSIEWILQNKAAYLKLMPGKVFRLWLGDDYHRKTFDKDYEASSATNKGKRILEIAGYSLSYYLVVVMAMISICFMGRRLWGRIGLWLLPILAACAMHALMYGGMRYHYPYMPLLIFYASIAASRMISVKKQQVIC